MRSTFAVRETASLGQQMLNAPLGINGLNRVRRDADEKSLMWTGLKEQYEFRAHYQGNKVKIRGSQNRYTKCQNVMLLPTRTEKSIFEYC